MIRCEITENGDPVAEVVVIELGPPRLNGEVQDYNVRVIIDKGPSVGGYMRTIYDWPTTSLNPISLAKAALALIGTEEAAMEGDHSGGGVSSDMARQVGGTLRALQAGQSSVRDNRSSVRSGQQE